MKNIMIPDGNFWHDKRLSWRAKGMLAFCLLLDKDHRFAVNQLIGMSTNKDRSVYVGFNELKMLGYATYEARHNPDTGDYIGKFWVFRSSIE